ncbi:MAG: DNA repair protein RadA, partial [Actinomycetota bacterium]|nr:DNA repair protein RadA [Actinomycetota bacterium]
RRAGMQLTAQDCYASTVGGARLGEPAADLALALAVASAHTDKPVPQGTVAVGEVGLAGDLRPVTGLPRRLAEAARIGFRRAVVPVGSLTEGPAPPSMVVLEAGSVTDAVSAALDGGPTGSG